MAITYTWKINTLKVRNEGSLENVVVQTYWTKTGTDENGNQGTFNGATPFTKDPNDASGPFIPFEQLTEQDVLSWIQSVVVGSYEEHVNNQIQKQIDDKINAMTEVSGNTLPWQTSTL